MNKLTLGHVKQLQAHKMEGLKVYHFPAVRLVRSDKLITRLQHILSYYPRVVNLSEHVGKVVLVAH